MESLQIDAGVAYSRQRSVIAREAARIRRLVDAVGRPGDLWPFQWAQLMSFALEMRPDLIIELGRGYGNSTCAFTEVASLLGPETCRVVSVCISADWDARTRARIQPLVAETWFDPLKVLRRDILTWDLETEVGDAQRVLLFWDAHGFDIAEWVLGRAAPVLAERQHAIVMHDMSDTRYQDASRSLYSGMGVWRANHVGRLRIGVIDSAVEQAVALLDFTTRNRIDLRSAEHEIRTYFATHPEEQAASRALLDDMHSLYAGWFWLRLESCDGRAISYPRFNPGTTRRPASQRVRLAAKMLIRGHL